jgi:predicted RNA-binding protein with PUA-like domain
MPEASVQPEHWLFKSEPDVFSLDDLHGCREPELWDGIRNYQARNFMRDQMQPGHQVLFYHSNCAQPGIVGLAEVASGPQTDPSAFDVRSPYHDPKSDPAKPRWVCVAIRYVAHFKKPLSLQALKADPVLQKMRVAQKGNRLSITPVAAEHFAHVLDRVGHAA